MKRKCLSLLIATFTICSCSLTEIEVTENNLPITFGAYTGVQTSTRSAETKLDNMKTTGFGIMAYMTAGEYANVDASLKQFFMDNQQVTYDTGTSGWTYSPTKYWPENGTDRLSFFAYAPYDADGSKGITMANDNGTPKLTLSAADPLKTPDLVLANEPAQMNLTGDKLTNSKVTFQFKHVLSRARMVAKIADAVNTATTKVCVEKVELASGSKLAKTATLDMTTETWTPGGMMASAVSTPDTKIALNNTDFTNVFGENQDLFFIPVTTEEGDVTMKITYNLIAMNGDTEGYISRITKEFSLPAGSFEAKKSYIYKFTIGLDGIKMETEIGAFIPVEEDGKTMIIRTATDLVRFRDRVNGSGDYTEAGVNPDLKAVQLADIDMNEATENSTGWIPIKDYAGTYNGNGYKIKNLKLTTASVINNNTGLFANTKSSSLLTGICIESGSLCPKASCTGAMLAGTTEGTVSYCSAIFNYAHINNSNNASVCGGLIGTVNAGYVTYCYASCKGGTIYAGTSGCFVGINKGTIVACYTQYSFMAENWYRTAGGFSGTNEGQVYGCYGKGTISTILYNSVGAFAGTMQAAGAVVASCYSNSTLNTSASYYTHFAGFIANYNKGTITNCYSICNMKAKTANTSGGFIYSNNTGSATPSISNCFCKTTATSVGLRHFSYAGTTITAVTNCYTTGTPVGASDITGLTVDESLTAPPEGTRPIDWRPETPVTIKTTKANPAKRYYPTTVEEVTLSSGTDLWEEEPDADGYPRIKGLE